LRRNDGNATLRDIAKEVFAAFQRERTAGGGGNLERALRALDQWGDPGLQRELDRIYPSTGLETVDWGPDTHAVRVKNPTPSVPYSENPAK